MLNEIAAIVFGIGLLVWAADIFVEACATLAKILGISPMIIGLSIVAFGTSAPELVVSAVAALEGNRNIGLGNAVGSNITNIGLVLGITALFTPIMVKSKIFKLEYPLLLINTLVVIGLLMDQDFSRIDGLILVSLLILDSYLITRSALAQRIPNDLNNNLQLKPRIIFGLLFGLALLLASSELLVWGAENTARRFGVSDLVIGLTIIATGTSLPELAAAVSAAIKKHHEMIIGNIIGSNIFNIAAVMTMPAFIHPGKVDASLLYRDNWVMGGLTLLLPLLIFSWPGKRGYIGRGSGITLLAAFVGYYVLLYFTVQ